MLIGKYSVLSSIFKVWSSWIYSVGPPKQIQPVVKRFIERFILVPSQLWMQMSAQCHWTLIIIYYKFSCKIMFFSFLYSTRIVCGSFSGIIMWKCCCTLHVPISKQQKWRNVNKFCWKLDILHPMTPFCCSTFLWFSSGWLLLFWKQKRVHWGWFLGQLENWNRHNGMCSCIKIRMALQDWALKQKKSNCSWLKSSVDIS